MSQQSSYDAPGFAERLDSIVSSPSRADSIDCMGRLQGVEDGDHSMSMGGFRSMRSEPEQNALEQKLSILLKLFRDQVLDRDRLECRLNSIDEKLSQLVPEKEKADKNLRRKMSMVSKKMSKNDTPSDSNNAADFNDIDLKLGLRVMKAAKRRNNEAGPAWRHSASCAGSLDKNLDAPSSPRNKDFARQVSRESDQVALPKRKVKAASVKELTFTTKPKAPSMKELTFSSSMINSVGATANQPSSLPHVLELDSSIGSTTQTPSKTQAETLPTPGNGKREKTETGGRTLNRPETSSQSIAITTGLNTSGEVSLSHLFRHRETQLIPSSPAPGSPRLSAEIIGMQSVEDSSGDQFWEGLPPRVPRALRCWLAACEFSLRACGLTPLVQCRADPDASGPAKTLTAEIEQEPGATVVSKLYHSLILFILFGCVGAAAATHFDFCEECYVALASDAGIAFGALMAVWSCGGIYTFFKSARMQLQMTDLLEHEVESTGLDNYWMRQKGKDSVTLVVVWLLALSMRIALGLHSGTLDTSISIAHVVLHALASACLIGACYLHMAMWRGISLTIVAFARSVLEGETSCQQARGKWREVISCMRQTSRMYQLTAAAFGLTTLMVVFGALFDVQQGKLWDALPNLALGATLPGALYVAASATAHCTRLPSLVSMLDGDEELEAEYMSLSLFLTLSESGFFMWDTRVTLAVLQKFLYFTSAIVGTIGFQLKVFHL
ncbi:unnamed protein product [Effrenium voratum]|uniref:Uncharacterized protein n=1 Tax=Effrenium voratum TaxID=2562239 RepID=A0AA36MVA1_9DINO|nr:unnamed protein product [Effrenium voratum]CAJ1457526.1 unnamed protein product [Effrenium voratum]|mmetsp:Transcript_120101/g.285322  ORF Transcript_120101/g.285322 Transcript_120101/m.285322 type:complete len:725 (+) Transcript_120101:28-2202(+)